MVKKSDIVGILTIIAITVLWCLEDGFFTWHPFVMLSIIYAKWNVIDDQNKD